MADANNNPSQDPANTGSMGGMMREILRKFLQSTDGMLPCTVIAASADRKFVTAKPQIMVMGTDEVLVSRATIAQVPVFTIGAGGFVLTFPVKAGDAGWILASDRDISLYVQSAKETGPNTDRLHSFEDAVFIPDAARLYTLAGEDADNAVLQSLDGTVRVAVAADHVKVTAPTVTFATPTAHFTGDVNVDGTVTATTDVVGGGKRLKTHEHSGVTTGGGTTGPPV